MVSQADRELIRNFVNELRPYLDTVRVGVQEFAQPNRDGVIVGQAVQALMMVRGAGQILMVDGLVSIAGWMVESVEKTQNNPDIEPADALKRLTGLYSAIDDYLNALDRGEDPDAIVLRAKTIYEAIPGYGGPVPGVSSQAQISALFDDDEHTAQTPRAADHAPPLVPGKPAVAARVQPEPTAELPAAEAIASESQDSSTPVRETPARIVPPPPQPTDPLPLVDPELREIFEEEAQEIVAVFGDGIRELVRAPSDKDAIRTLQRAAHTLKGAANMTGFPLIAQIGAAIELLFDEQLESSEPVERDVFELIAVSWKMLRSMLPRLDDLSGFTSPSNSIVRRAADLRERVAAANAAARPAETERTQSEARIVSIPEAEDRPITADEAASELTPVTPADAPVDDAPPALFVGGIQETTRELPAVDSDQGEDMPAVPLDQDAVELRDPPAAGQLEDSTVVEEAPIEPAAEAEATEIEPQSDGASEGALWSAGEAADVFDEQLDPTPFWSAEAGELPSTDIQLDPAIPADEAGESFAQPISESAVDSFFAEEDDEIVETPAEVNLEWQRPQTDLLNFDDTPQTEPFWNTGLAPEPEAHEVEAGEPAIIDPFQEPVVEEPDFFYDDADEDEEPAPAEFETPPAEEDDVDQVAEVAGESATPSEVEAEPPPGDDEYLVETAEPAQVMAAHAETADAPATEGVIAEAGSEDQAAEAREAERRKAAEEILFAFDSRLSELAPPTKTAKQTPPVGAVETTEGEPAAYPFEPTGSGKEDHAGAHAEFTLESEAEEVVLYSEEILDDVRAESGIAEDLEDVVASLTDDSSFGDLDWFEQPDEVEAEDFGHVDEQADDEPPSTGLLGVPDTGMLGEVDSSAPTEPATGSLDLGALDISSFLSAEASIARSADLLDMAFSSHQRPTGASAFGDETRLGTTAVFDESSDLALEVEMFETFSAEAEEHIAILNRAAILLDRDPAASAPLVDTKRALHTIKGAAAAADFMEVSDIAHQLEDSLAEHEQEGTLDNRAFTAALFDALEEIEGKIAGRKDQIFGAGEQDERGPTVRIDVARVDDLLNTVGELVVNRSSFEERLERLEASIEDLSSAATRLQRASYLLDREANAEDAIGRLLRGEISDRSPIMEVASAQGEWDMLEMDRYTEFDRLIRQLAEVGADVTAAVGEVASLRGDFDTVSTRQGRLTTALQDELMSIRMVPISSLAPSLYRVVRGAAERRGKEVNLVIEGGETPFDKTLLDTLNESLLHLLRNAVDHGIEEAEGRRRAGKPDLGSIRIRAFRDGSEAVIEIIDDGAGIDHEAVIETAEERGLAVPDNPSREEALSLIFTSGFTTRPEVDDISGRGLGLEIVQQTVSQFKGRVAVDSILGRGTIFSLRLPVMLSVIQAFLVRAGSGEFAIPVANVDYVVDRIDQPLTQIGDSIVVETASEVIPVVDVSARVGQSLTPVLERDEGWIMVTEIAGRRWALVVDELRGQQEIVVKPMGRFLRATPGLMGATILGHGDVALIIDVPALLGVNTLSTRLDNVTRSAAEEEFSAPVIEPEPKRATPTVLVVDDSLSVRRVVSRTIERRGWIPVLARDGLEALELLEQGHSGVILTDIEMPRMDGFELITTVRNRPEFAGLPIVVLTSRSGDKHRDRAIGLGANEYLVKPFQEQELIDVIESVRKVHSEV